MDKISKLWVIAKKEMKELASSKRSFLISLFFAGWFGLNFSQNLGPLDGSVDAVLYILTIVMGAFFSFILSAQIFMREKLEKTIIDLLCVPLSLLDIWLGKVLGVLIFAYGFNILSVLVVIATHYYQNGQIVLSSGQMIFHMLVNLPVFIGFAVGLNGLVQLLLGIKENRIAYFAAYIVVFAAMFIVMRFTDTGYSISWILVWVSFLVACILFSTVFWLVKRASKEKIITTD